MNVLTMILISLCVVLTAISGWLFGRDRANRLDIEKLYDSVAQLAQDQAKLRKTISSAVGTAETNRENIDSAFAQIKEVDKKIGDAAQAQEEAAAAIAKQIEKRWDNGLQNMLAWNPFDAGSEGN
jgi:methyl-accepting chemotaxis protein